VCEWEISKQLRRRVDTFVHTESFYLTNSYRNILIYVLVSQRILSETLHFQMSFRIAWLQVYLITLAQKEEMLLLSNLYQNNICRMQKYDIKEEEYELVCPITNEIFEDAVQAEDGITYEHSGIESWFDSLRKRNLPIVSPCTRTEIGTSLQENAPASAHAAKLRESLSHPNSDQVLDAGAASQGISSIHDLRRIFASLDSVRDILEQTLEGWQPPQLVVIGQESSGKSTILERLAIMPIFPRDRKLCTRMPIHGKENYDPGHDDPLKWGDVGEVSCIYVYMYVCIHVCMYTMYVCIHVCMLSQKSFACLYLCVRVCVHACLKAPPNWVMLRKFLYVYMYIYIYVCMYRAKPLVCLFFCVCWCVCVFFVYVCVHICLMVP
jgi:hypothetical protein